MLRKDNMFRYLNARCMFVEHSGTLIVEFLFTKGSDDESREGLLRLRVASFTRTCS